MDNGDQKNQVNIKTQIARHYLFLNPHLKHAFTRCPKCTAKTKVRKYCLVIRIEPHHFISLNKTCRYCPYCDLVIVKKQDLEQVLCGICEHNFPEIIGNDYFIFGTIERKDWKKGQQNDLINSKKLMECTYPFRDVWHFEVEPAKWVYLPKNKKIDSEYNYR